MNTIQKTSLAIIAVLAFGAGWMANGWRLTSTFQKEKAKAVQEASDRYTEATQRLHDAAVEHVNMVTELEMKIDALKKDLANAKKKRPLPADCRPDDDRLRVLKSAVAAANATAGY